MEKPELIFQKYNQTYKNLVNLLLIADPSLEAIERYIHESEIYTVESDNLLLGVIVLYPIDKNTVEIKNIAVEPNSQGKGVGSYLLEKSFAVCKNMGYTEIIIGTANSSLVPIHVYKKMGFVEKNVICNFFLEHYDEPIFENSIQAVDMIVFKKSL